MRFRAAIAAFLIAGQAGCGSAHRLLDASIEPAPEAPAHAPVPLSARAVCEVVFEDRAVREWDRVAPARLALFGERRSHRLAHHVRESGLFTGAAVGSIESVGDPSLRLALTEQVLAAPAYHFRCLTGLVASMLIGIGIPFIPLMVATSYRYRDHDPGLRERLTLVVSSEEGEELARLSTLRVIRIEEQENGCEAPDPLLGSPHPAAFDLAFDSGVCVLLARLMADEELLARIERAIAATCARSRPR